MFSCPTNIIKISQNYASALDPLCFHCHINEIGHLNGIELQTMNFCIYLFLKILGGLVYLTYKCASQWVHGAGTAHDKLQIYNLQQDKCYRALNLVFIHSTKCNFYFIISHCVSSLQIENM